MKRIVISLLVLSGLTFSLFAQDKEISGVINVYKRVVAIGPGFDNVTLNNVDSIAPGDTVLLIQMQGVGIVTDQDAYGRGVQSKFGEPGEYEFLLVQSVNGGTNQVVFRNNILNPFDIRGNVQLVRVPYYNTATVTGTLTSKSWSSTDKTGGVLAMIVGRKLKLNSDINVSLKGFSGGKDTIGIGECVEINPAANNHDSYPRNYLNAGYKGEGLAIHDQFGVLLDPLHMKGQGINLTGGGGGNGKYSGGGGGSNRGLGGDGTSEKDFGLGACNIVYPGAFGGTSVISTVISEGIFFGGGGGASIHAAGSSGSSGGTGGGIVIIIADTISGNRSSIKADGGTAGNAVGDGGAGGGGGGGSIVLSLQSFSDVADDSLKISVRGGNGGTNPGGFGNGGGGGGGLVWVSTGGMPGKVPVLVNYGIPGPFTATQGNGQLKFSFTPRLNGFLFNSIRSEVTGNQVDSICSDVPFGKITGTIPVGGVIPHTYLWEQSTTSETTGFSAASGINNEKDYSPGILTQTSWFRRVVTDNDTPQLIDISKPVKIIVQQAITGNLIGKDTIICQNQDPLELIPLNSGPSDGSSYNYYNYLWKESLTDSNWDTAPVAAGPVSNAPDYDPTALAETTFYKRIVTSGRCIDYSSTVTITVLPLITGNITVRSDSVICEGTQFSNLAATAPGGGDLTYLYQWQDSSSLSGWLPALGSNTGSVYTPDTSAFSGIENRFFRRVVYSGPANVCRDIGSPINLTRYFKLTKISIFDNQVICSGTTPADLTGEDPENGAGAGTYSYLWLQSTNGLTFSPAAGINDLASGSYQPPALTDTTWYRRVVNSGIYNAAPVCTDTSLSKRVDVHKPILNNVASLISGTGPDTTICSGAVPDSIIGGIPSGGTGIPDDYAYLWESSILSATSGFSAAPGDNTGRSYKPGALDQTTWLRRSVISGICNDPSNSIEVIVLPPITNNIITGNQTICTAAIPDQITGSPLSGGAGGIPTWIWQESSDGVTWQPATGTGNQQNYSSPSLTSPMNYRRIIHSGLYDCCIDTSNVISVLIHTLPSSQVFAGSDTTIFSFDNIILMNADPVYPYENGIWTLVSGSGDFTDDTDNRSEVRNLSKGENTFLWKVINGPCESEDMVVIYVNDLVIPEGFSPNDDPDNYNNTFMITGLNLPEQIAELTVVNGAGTEVFYTSNIDGREWNDWDGKNSKGIDLPEGTYYYLLKIISKANGQVFKKSGFIVLKRY